MGRHRAGDAAPSREWIDAQIGRRHRLSLFHDPSIALDNKSALLWLFPTRADVEDYAHRDEAYRNLGTSAALNVMRNVFADFDSYVLHLSDQRIVEHRPMRADDTLHSDVFIETYEASDGADVYGVRVVFTDTIGALVFTDHATFVGKLEPQQAPAPEDDVEPTTKASKDLAVSS